MSIALGQPIKRHGFHNLKAVIIQVHVRCPSIPRENTIEINLTDLGLAFASRGLTHIQNPTPVPRGPHFGPKDEHSRIWEATMEIIPKLAVHLL